MMDVWEMVLAFACLGTFILEVWGFGKIIKLIINIKDGMGISEDGSFDTGHMLKCAIVNIGLTLGEVDAKGKPTADNMELQQALSNIFGFGSQVMMQQISGGSGVPGVTKPVKLKGFWKVFEPFINNPQIQNMAAEKAVKVIGDAGEEVVKHKVDEAIGFH